MYTTGQEARQELLRRREDYGLKNRVEAFLGNLPNGFPREPFAGSLPHVASARLYDFCFREEARKIGLQSWWFEYLTDEFNPNNPDKNGLWKLRVLSGYGRKGGARVHKVNIVGDPHRYRKKRINDLLTLRGESVVEFHHRLHRKAFPEDNVLDMSSWIKSCGGKAERYYPSTLCLFIWHGILFDDFHAQIPGLDEFRERLVIPSFERVKREIGVPPLIVRLKWEPSLDWYPDELFEE